MRAALAARRSSAHAYWIDLDDATAWDEAVAAAGGDVFAGVWFHRIAMARAEGVPRLFVFREGSSWVVLPLLLRDLPAGAGFDATSVYGYAGPASNVHPDREHVLRFTDALREHLHALGVICVFSRLHPIEADHGGQHHGWLEGLGTVDSNGTTVSIELRGDPEQRRAQYRGSHRREIARLRREGFTFEEGTPADLETFTRLYDASMQRLEADERYTFEPAHMRALVEHGMHLLVVRRDEDVAAAGLFSDTGRGSHYFLSATADAHRKWAPCKQLLDGACDWARARGLDWLHLGGGLGGREDALFRFKAGFGPRRHTFRTWRCILDERRYRANCLAAGVSHEDMFFPAYRSR